ncbi:MAG: hypothetical protein V5A55_10655 [Halovenus sp.]
MNAAEQLMEQGIDVRRVEAGDSIELVADFGRGADASVDVVGDTVIVIADDEQYDIETETGAQAQITNGVLTIEVDA